MSMCEDYALAPLSPVGDVRPVGQHEVHAEHLFVRKRQPRIHDHDAAFELEHEHVATDLSETPEEDDTQGAQVAHRTPARSSAARTAPRFFSLAQTGGSRGSPTAIPIIPSA